MKNRPVVHPIIEYEDSIQFVGTGPSVEAATEAAAEHAVGYVTAGTDLDREEAYMLLSIIGELRIGTSPRPIMAARLIVPRETAGADRLERTGRGLIRSEARRRPAHGVRLVRGSARLRRLPLRGRRPGVALRLASRGTS